jgi:hypothetical protein
MGRDVSTEARGVLIGGLLTRLPMKSMEEVGMLVELEAAVEDAIVYTILASV